MRRLNFLAALAIVAIVASCTGGGGSPLVNEAKKNVSNKNFRAALEAANQAIAEDPTNHSAFYYKAVALNGLAGETTPISARESLYQELYESSDKARSLFEALPKLPAESILLDNMQFAAWAAEHNAAIELATNDSLLAVDNVGTLALAEAHLKNAIAINPDSVMSYEILSEVYRFGNNIEMAAEYQKRAMNVKGGGTEEDYDRLASFYTMSNKPQQAVEVLEEGTSKFPDDINLIQKLADAYMSIGKKDKSLETVEGLITKDPTNPQYYLVLGTQIYQAVLPLSDEVSANSDQIFDLSQVARSARGEELKQIQADIKKLDKQNEELTKEIVELSDRAEQALLKTVELRPDDELAYSVLGIIYQNKAAAILEARNRESDNKKADQLDKEGKDALRKAMGFYEKAAEINPDNPDNWMSLFQVYTALDMREKAEEAQKKAGM